jgi:Asp-tRNA(Asn)/Glu-tRNA(Gln) amidotransferase A subunit family amidase
MGAVSPRAYPTALQHTGARTVGKGSSSPFGTGLSGSFRVFQGPENPVLGGLQHCRQNV